LGGVADLFSSPSKQAQQAGQAQQGLAQNEINQVEGYVSNAEQQQRGAIAGLGTNPYFGSSSGTGPLPTPTPVNPSNTANFGPNGAAPSTLPSGTVQPAAQPTMRRSAQ
jgi:hypothetical protein